VKLSLMSFLSSSVTIPAPSKICFCVIAFPFLDSH
jgi:hypothetical protein